MENRRSAAARHGTVHAPQPDQDGGAFPQPPASGRGRGGRDASQRLPPCAGSQILPHSDTAQDPGAALGPQLQVQELQPSGRLFLYYAAPSLAFPKVETSVEDMFFGPLDPDPDPLVRDPDPDPSIIKQKL
jgi:hypothetical protein